MDVELRNESDMPADFHWNVPRDNMEACHLEARREAKMVAFGLSPRGVPAVFDILCLDLDRLSSAGAHAPASARS